MARMQLGQGNRTPQLILLSYYRASKRYMKCSEKWATISALPCAIGKTAIPSPSVFMLPSLEPGNPGDMRPGVDGPVELPRCEPLPKESSNGRGATVEREGPDEAVT